MGRGAPLSSYRCNVKLRALVTTRQDDYANAKRRRSKDRIAREILDELHCNRHARFLNKVSSTDTERGGTVWMEAHEDAVLEKIKQALRHRENGSELSTTTTRSQRHRKPTAATTTAVTAVAATVEVVTAVAAATVDEGAVPVSSMLRRGEIAATTMVHVPSQHVSNMAQHAAAYPSFQNIPSVAPYNVMPPGTVTAYQQPHSYSFNPSWTTESQRQMLAHNRAMHQIQAQQLEMVHRRQQLETQELQQRLVHERHQFMMSQAVTAAARVLPNGDGSHNNIDRLAAATAAAHTAMSIMASNHPHTNTAAPDYTSQQPAPVGLLLSAPLSTATSLRLYNGVVPNYGPVSSVDPVFSNPSTFYTANTFIGHSTGARTNATMPPLGTDRAMIGPQQLVQDVSRPQPHMSMLRHSSQ